MLMKLFRRSLHSKCEKQRHRLNRSLAPKKYFHITPFNILLIIELYYSHQLDFLAFGLSLDQMKEFEFSTFSRCVSLSGAVKDNVRAAIIPALRGVSEDAMQVRILCYDIMLLHFLTAAKTRRFSPPFPYLCR